MVWAGRFQQARLFRTRDDDAVRWLSPPRVAKGARRGAGSAGRRAMKCSLGGLRSSRPTLLTARWGIHRGLLLPGDGPDRMG